MEERDFPISAYLSNPSSSDGWWVGFPTNKEDLKAALKALGSESGRVDVQYYATGESELHNRLPKKLNADNLDELNFLAVRLEEMSESERDIFDAVVEAGWHCESLSDIINISENLETFDIQPAYSAEEYGAFHINLARDEYADIMNNLEVSSNPRERDFFSYVADIESHVDFAAYGRLQAEREDGAFTDQGYLTSVGAFVEVYRGHHDLPDDFRVYDTPEITSVDHEPIAVAEFSDKIQALMDETYNEWRNDENRDKSKWDVLGDFSVSHQVAVTFGNFNYQVENGGIEQWIYNGYFQDDAEKFIEFLEIGAETDDRCRNILDKVYQLDQYAHETDCDRYGNFYDTDNDGDSSFIGDIINCDKFDSWYYDNCGKEDWWGNVCGIMDKAEARLALTEDHEHPAAEKQSVLDKIHEAMALPKQPHKPKAPDKSGPEL